MFAEFFVQHNSHLDKASSALATSENQTSFQQSEPLYHLFQYVSMAINKVLAPLEQLFSMSTTSFPVTVDQSAVIVV